ncbi:MAG: hypothetical protein U0636_02305 [Phycisphaerales bacterium]
MTRPVILSVPCLALALLAAAPQDSAPAAPKAAPPAAKPVNPAGRVAPATKDDLEIRPGSLMLITDTQSGQPYWVFTYQVVNKTGKSQRFAPTFELVTGEGKILAAGADVPPEAQRRLQRALGKVDAADQFQIMGDILEGEANARDGIVVWPASAGDTKELTMFITGLSRAVDVRTDPASGQTVNLRRTMQRSYTLPGQPDPRVAHDATLVSETWLMR